MKHQDYIYFNEDYYNNPKEMFVWIGDLIEKYTDILQVKYILDIGCARGEMIYYLKSRFKNTVFYGVDYSSDLIESARDFVGLKDVELIVESADSFLLDKKFDTIILVGVLCYFDEIDSVLEKIKKHLNKNGIFLLCGGFLDSDVDLRVRYRNNAYFNEFLPGWNLHSIHTIKKECAKQNLLIKSIEKFDLSFKLDPQADPCRAWHIDTEDGRKYTNGMGMIYDIRALVIQNC